MKLLLPLCAALFAGCATQVSPDVDWPAPFPLYVANHAGVTVWVVWTFDGQEKRTEVVPGESTKILPPFVTDSDQPEKRIVAIESDSARFDLTVLQPSRIPQLWFVVEDAVSVSVHSRSGEKEPVMILKGGRPNQPPQRNAGSRPSLDDSPASDTASSLDPRG